MATSPNNTIISKSGQTITDAAGTVWSITAGGQVAVNGKADPTTTNVIEMAFVNGTVWQENKANQWFSKKMASDAWATGSDPLTLTWIGGGTNIASNPANWNPTIAPEPGDTLIMNTGTMIIASMDLAGNPLTTVNGNITLANAVSSSATVTVNASGTTDTLTLGGNVGGTLTIIVNMAGNTDLILSPVNNVRLFSGTSLTVNGGTTTINGTLSTDSKFVLNTNMTGTGTLALKDAADADGTITPVFVEVNGNVTSGLTFDVDGTGGNNQFSGTPSLSDDSLQIDNPRAFAGNLLVNQGMIALENFITDSYIYTNNMMTFYQGNQVVETFKVAPAGTLLPNTMIVPTQTNNTVVIATEPSSYKGALPIHMTPPPQPPPPTVNFLVEDTSTSMFSSEAGQSYTGPVPGLSNEYIKVTADNLNVTAKTANVFIRTGSGEDALNVSEVNGNNVLDGDTNSNFLVGGTGKDTFFADAQDASPSNPVWSTMVNFHGGDNATVWGVTAQDFNISWVDGLGATGFTGLTMIATANGQAAPTALVTIPGYSTTDMNNGRISASFGTSPQMPGLPSTPYMLIHAN